MGLWSKEQLYQFIKENKLVTEQNALFAETLQKILETEMDTNLGYEMHEVKNKTTINARNGKIRKTVSSEYGGQEISVPRDRLSEFGPMVVKKHQSNVTGNKEQIVFFIPKGLVLGTFRIISPTFTE